MFNNTYFSTREREKETSEIVTETTEIETESGIEIGKSGTGKDYENGRRETGMVLL